MPWSSPHVPALRETVEALLRDTDLTMIAIAAQTGVPRGTITTWNARAGWRRPTRVNARGLSPANWPQSRREAVARLYYEPRVDPGDLAEAVGTKRGSARALFLACGLTGRRPHRSNPPPAPLAGPEGVLDTEALNAALRAHIARQIAAFDAALQGQAAAVIDSAKVLRDLGGLKRLLDETAGPRDRWAGGAYGGRPEPPADLEPLREAIARRYAAFAGERPDAALPGDAAPPPADGAGR